MVFQQRMIQQCNIHAANRLRLTLRPPANTDMSWSDILPLVHLIYYNYYYYLYSTAILSLKVCSITFTSIGYVKYQNISRSIFQVQSLKCWHGTCKKNVSVTFTMFKGALYRIWCGVNRLGDSGVKVV